MNALAAGDRPGHVSAPCSPANGRSHAETREIVPPPRKLRGRTGGACRFDSIKADGGRYGRSGSVSGIGERRRARTPSASSGRSAERPALIFGPDGASCPGGNRRTFRKCRLGLDYGFGRVLAIGRLDLLAEWVGAEVLVFHEHWGTHLGSRPGVTAVTAAFRHNVETCISAAGDPIGKKAAPGGYGW